MGTPGERIDRGGVEGEIVDFRPDRLRLAVDEDFAIVAGGGEDVAVFRVGPGDGPDGSFMSD